MALHCCLVEEKLLDMIQLYMQHSQIMGLG